MPAYRSDAEGEIRDAVVDKIRTYRPKARIIHEINALNAYAGATCRIDVLVVDRTEIIAVEIKSKKDKLDRLEAQISAMRGVAHRTVVALHEKFLVEKQTNRHAAHYERDGVFYMRRPPMIPNIGHRDVDLWVYPQKRRVMDPGAVDFYDAWHFPYRNIEAALPDGAISMLWRAELLALCQSHVLPCGRRTTMGKLIAALRWHCTGAEITKGVCAALRARQCVEADPPITCEVKATE